MNYRDLAYRYIHSLKYAAKLHPLKHGAAGLSWCLNENDDSFSKEERERIQALYDALVNLISCLEEVTKQ